MVNAVVLAGAANNGMLKECSDAAYEALIKINNLPMVQYVVNALAEAQKVKAVYLVGPKEVQKEIKGDYQFILSGQTILESIEFGIAAAGLEDDVLLVTSDIPMITPEMIDQFIAQCAQFEADFYYPIVEKSVNEKLYPGVRRTYVHTRDGVFTGGNLFLLNPAIFKDCREFAQKLFQYRKKPWKLCQLLGWRFVFKLLFRTITIREAEKRVEEILGIKGAAIISPYPEIGIDVDKPSDYYLVEQKFASLEG